MTHPLGIRFAIAISAGAGWLDWRPGSVIGVLIGGAVRPAPAPADSVHPSGAPTTGG